MSRPELVRWLDDILKILSPKKRAIFFFICIKFLSCIRLCERRSRLVVLQFSDKQIIKCEPKFISRGNHNVTVSQKIQKIKATLALVEWFKLLNLCAVAANSIGNLSSSFRSWISTDLHIENRFFAENVHKNTICCLEDEKLMVCVRRTLYKCEW